MVQNKLTKETLLDRAEDLVNIISFPIANFLILVVPQISC